MIDRNCVASGTTFSSLVKKRTIGSAINGRERIVPNTKRNTAPIHNAI